MLYHQQQVWAAHFSAKCKAYAGEVTEIGTDVEAWKEDRGAAAPYHHPARRNTSCTAAASTTTHSLLRQDKESSAGNWLARGVNSEIDLFSEGRGKTKEAGAQHSLKLG